MDIRSLLTAYWITFPENPHFPAGQGVTAFTVDDAFFLLEERGYLYHRRAPRVAIREISSVDELDYRHVVVNMGPIVTRGIWYPCLNIGIDASGRFNRLPLERRTNIGGG